MDLGLQGRRALVSASTAGIGLAVAQRLLREGAQVAICGRDPGTLAEALAELGSEGRVVGQVCDFADGDAVADWVAASASALEGIDIVVSNASASGQHGDGTAPWELNFQVDLLSTVRLCEAALPYLERSDAASIVQIATVTAIEHHDTPINPSYGAMKAAGINYMAQLAQRWGPRGIRANSVSPGPILIEGRKWASIRERRPELFARDRDAHPLKRMGTAAEVADIVAVLASPVASWVNGANLVVDGGFTKRVGF